MVIPSRVCDLDQYLAIVWKRYKIMDIVTIYGTIRYGTVYLRAIKS